MAEKFTKLDHRFGLIKFPLTFGELKEAVSEIPKTERTFYELSFTALAEHLKDRDLIHYFTEGSPSLLKTGGFVIVADKKLYITSLTGGIKSIAIVESINYALINAVDFDLLPFGSSDIGRGSVILDLDSMLPKEKTIRNIHERDLEDLVESIKFKVGPSENKFKMNNLTKKERQSKELELFFGDVTGKAEEKLISSFSSALHRLRTISLEKEEKVILTLPVNYEDNKKKKVKGIFIATDRKFAFSADAAFKNINEVWEYDYISEISQSDNKVSITYDQEMYTLEPLKKHALRAEDLNDIHSRFMNSSKQNDAAEIIEEDEISVVEELVSPPSADKYDQLIKIAELKEAGILTEEEFQAEKVKILNTK